MNLARVRIDSNRNPGDLSFGGLLHLLRLAELTCRRTSMTPLRTLLPSLLLFAALPCAAQNPPKIEPPPDSKLIHLDTPHTMDRRGTGFRLDVRPFGSDEDLLYTSLALHYGLCSTCEAILRGTFADRKNLF